MPDLLKLVGEEMDGVTAEQRKRLQSIEAETRDVKKQLDRLWRYIATSDDVDPDRRVAGVDGFAPNSGQGP